MAIRIIRYLNNEDELEPRTSTFSSGLEARARAIVSPRDAETDDPVTSAVTDEIALTLDQIDRTRDLHKRLQRDLIRLECYTNSELMQMEARMPRYSPYRFPEREKLQRRLIGLHGDRGRLAMEEDRALTGLQRRLLESVHRRMHLDG